MQCQCCKQHTATIHLTEIQDGQRNEIHMCELCAQKQGLAVKSQVPLNELLSTLLAAQTQVTGSSSDDLSMGSQENIECPACGMTLRQFQKESLLGCANDYDVFENTLGPLIEKTQGGNTTHCGKVPLRAPTAVQKQAETMNLRTQLQDAVKTEDYEKAAKLRDKIGKLDETQ